MSLLNILSYGLVALLTIGACLVGTYAFNRSRWTLQEAKQQSGLSEQELQELIREGLLTSRRKYVLSGPFTFDRYEVIEVRDRYPELQEARAAVATAYRQAAEDAAARIHESDQRYQEQVRLQQEELERMKRVYAEILKHFEREFLPPQVADALHLLGLPTDASFDAIHKRYRELAKQHHPDRGGDPEQFKRIQAAYSCVVAWIQSQDS